MDKFIGRTLNSIFPRLLLAGFVIFFPVGLASTWVGAAYQVEMWGVDFADTLLRMLFFGTIAYTISGILVIYPLELWVIRDRAFKSIKWTTVRVLLYTLAGLPMGFAILVSFRFGIREYSSLLESVYYVQSVTAMLVVALFYSFIERAVEAVRRREAMLMKEIEALRIEIDEVEKARQVARIIETEHFQQIKAMAKKFKQELKGAQAQEENKGFQDSFATG